MPPPLTHRGPFPPIDLLYFADDLPKYTDGSVTVLVEQQKFSASEALLTRTSPFFESALRNQWLETQQRTVELPELEAVTFHRYIHWLHSGKIAISRKSNPEMFADLVQLYLLGQRLMNENFQNAVMTALIVKIHFSNIGQKITFYPNREAIEAINANTVEGDPLRRFLVDLLLINGWDDIDDVSKDCTDSFVEFARIAGNPKLAERRPTLGEVLGPQSICQYHRHPPGTDCYGEDEDIGYA